MIEITHKEEYEDGKLKRSDYLVWQNKGKTNGSLKIYTKEELQEIARYVKQKGLDK